ncbi:MAG TPA: hypothetical protein ENK95_03155, partial [Campylobacterales bacterium]|nr:hypothetical protein [Campylobacterales bacterium]
MKKIITSLVIGLLLTVSAVAQSIPAYLVGASASLGDVESKLKTNGFEILATTDNVVTITNDELKKTNTYVATLHVYVGKSGVRVQNPDYFGLAYLGDKYKQGQFATTLEALKKSLGSLKGSEEKLGADELPDYHFMMGMPYFDEPITVANKAKIYNQLQGNDNILYSVSLPNGTILVGHKLSNETSKFLKTLKQTHNSQILPYEAL